MKIGSIGKGNVGGALARLWQQAGHDVRAGGRQDSIADIAAHGDVVLLAVGAEAVEDVLHAAGPLDGKVLIDATKTSTRSSARWRDAWPSSPPAPRW